MAGPEHGVGGLPNRSGGSTLFAAVPVLVPRAPDREFGKSPGRPTADTQSAPQRGPFSHGRNRSVPEVNSEAHLSTEHPSPGPPARFPPPDVHSGGAGDHQRPSTEGTPASERLIGSCRSGADFSRISAEGRSRSTRHLWIRSVSDPEVRPPRVAFAIGRRNGPAVRRNRARRRIRAALREVAADVAPGLHLIGWKGPIGEVDFIELKNELVDLMSRTEEHR